MKLIISGSSFLFPKNIAWNNLTKNYDLEFYDYGNWSGALINCSEKFSLIIILFLEDIVDSFEQEIDTEKIFNTFFQLLKQRLTKSTRPTLIMYASLQSSNPILEAQQLSKKREINSYFFNKLASFSKIYKSLYFVDLDQQFLEIGYKNALDRRNWYLAHCRLSIEGLFVVSDVITRIFKRVNKPPSKVLILDCDNTIWGGVLAEDGMQNLLLGQDGVGKAFVDFQKAIKYLSKNGILLAIASKNNEKDVLKVFREHEAMIIKEDDIVSWRVNWKEKYENLLSMSKELSLGLDSFVFWDDNPIERDKMQIALPDVNTIDIPKNLFDWSDYLFKLDNFSKFNITSDDLNKKKQYINRAKFIIDKKETINENIYLKSINLKPNAQEVSESNINRAVQLCSKTNQFNLRSIRHNHADLNMILKSNKEFCFLTSLKDKYGDHGYVGLICLTKIDSKFVFLDTFLLSCRILGRHLEAWMLKQALLRAFNHGYQYIAGEFLKTPKNNIVHNFLSTHGFTRLSDKENLSKKMKSFIVNKNLLIIATEKRNIPFSDIYD